jgi:hypothetical protein
MATLYKQISDKFLSQLSGSKEVNAKQIDRLRSLFADSKKLKVDDLVDVFTKSDANEIT